MSKEALVEMAAASEVSKVSVSELAKEFKGVGISLYDVGDKMAEVANYAKSVGVNVRAVSKDVVEKMNIAINRILQDPSIKKNLSERGIEIIGGSSAKFGEHIQNEVSKYAQIVKTSNMTID